MRLAVALLAIALPAAAQEEIEFRLAERIIVAEGTLNGRAATWIVDTGANATLVTPEAAERSGLEGTRHGYAKTIGVGGAVLRELKVSILDPPVAHFLRKAGVKYSGILGTTYLEQYLVTIDYPAKRLILAPPGPARDAGAGTGFEMKSRLIFVDARTGADALRLMLDSGAQATVVRPQCAKRLGIESRAVEGSDVRYGRLAALSVGDVTAKDVDVAVHEPSQMAQMERDGLAMDGFLGYTFLSRYKVTIDYKSKRVRFDEPGVEAPPSADRPPLGLDLDDTVVRDVEAGTAAAKAGFKIGDVLVSIDGKEVRLIEQIRAILRATKRGATVSVIVRRGKEKLTLTLTW